MKAQQLRAMSVAELDRHLLDLLKEQFKLRMQKGSGQLARPSRFKVVGREIARIKTVKGQLSRAATVSAKPVALTKTAVGETASGKPAVNDPAVNDPAASDRA